jgi:hypothetical protein
MRRYISILKYILIITALAAISFGCSSTVNPESPLSLVDASGNHPDGWIVAHGQYAAPDGSLCMDCHGDDLAGGITGVSCSSDAVGCHSGGPAFHPADWLDSSLTGNAWHGDAYDNGFQINGSICADCHGTIIGITWPDLPDPSDCVECHFTSTGGRYPIDSGWAHATTEHSSFAGSAEETVCVACHDVNISFGNQDSCHNCHDLPTHDVEYLDHDLDVPDSSDFTTLCSTCHAITGTSPNAGAPECVTCHTVGSPYTQTNCTSCHGNPPNTGEHNKHENEGASCDDCHQGAGSGSGLNHFYDIEVDIDFSEPGFTYISDQCTGTCHIGSEPEDHDNEDW